MKLSIVTTMYRSSAYIEPFYQRCLAACSPYCDDLEFIFVNDGSPDDSLHKAVVLAANDAGVVVVDLSRNFGHHKAIMTGLAHASGDRVFLIDCDLEEAPEWIAEFWQSMESQADVDVVYATQNTRKGNAWERITGDMVWQAINRLSEVPVPANLVTARLMTRRFVSALNQFKEHELFLAAIFSAAGFLQLGITVDKGSKDSTTYSLAKRVNLMVNGVTAFSAVPLMMVFYSGLVVSLGALVLTMFAAARQLIYGLAPSGWTSLLISIWLVGGLVIFSIGIIGIYLSRIFSETKDRPFTVVRKVYKNE